MPRRARAIVPRMPHHIVQRGHNDQSVGRFTQMDTWMGDTRLPLTLRKYLYANGAPPICLIRRVTLRWLSLRFQ